MNYNLESMMVPGPLRLQSLKDTMVGGRNSRMALRAFYLICEDKLLKKQVATTTMYRWI